MNDSDRHDVHHEDAPPADHTQEGDNPSSVDSHVATSEKTTIEPSDLAPSPLIGAGARLRAKRGLSIDDVARTLVMDRSVVEALERTERPKGLDERRTRLSARAYARYVGVAESVVAKDFPTPSEMQLAQTIAARQVPAERRKLMPGRFGFAVMATAGVVAAAISFVVLRPGSPAASAPSISDRVVAVNTAQESLFSERPDRTSMLSKPLPLELVAVRPAWIEVRGADGTIFRSRTMAASESYYPRVGAGWSVTARDAGAFEWRVNDQIVGRLGEDDVAIYSASIDEAATNAENFVTPELASTTNSHNSR